MPKPMTSEELAKQLSDGRLTVRVVGLRKEEIDGRPQLVVTLLQMDDVEPVDLILTRELARQFWRVLGPNKMVADFFKRGEGLQ
jgi:hypothetical protein